MAEDTRWTMESFRTADGLRLGYVVDDYTDPWQPQETLIKGRR